MPWRELHIKNKGMPTRTSKILLYTEENGINIERKITDAGTQKNINV